MTDNVDGDQSGLPAGRSRWAPTEGPVELPPTEWHEPFDVVERIAGTFPGDGMLHRYDHDGHLGICINVPALDGGHDVFVGATKVQGEAVFQVWLAGPGIYGPPLMRFCALAKDGSTTYVLADKRSSPRPELLTTAQVVELLSSEVTALTGQKPD